MKTFNPAEAIKAQRKLQQEKGYPDFAPATGICWRCKRQIYAEFEQPSGHKTGIDVEQAATGLVTGCPHC